MTSKEISHEIVSNYFRQVFHGIEVREYTSTLVPMLFNKTVDQIVANSLYFGVPLPILLKRTNNQIPRIIQDCYTFIKSRNFLDSEGIFRINGSHAKINKVVDLYNEKGEKFEILKHEGLWESEVASILKKWFRDLPGSIWTAELKDKFLHYGETGEQEMVFGISTLLLQLPPINQEIIKQLMIFLHTVSKRKANKMDANNLSTIFAPTLFDLWLSGHKQAGIILKSMIGNPRLYWDFKIVDLDKEKEQEKEKEKVKLEIKLDPKAKIELNILDQNSEEKEKEKEKEKQQEKEKVKLEIKLDHKAKIELNILDQNLEEKSINEIQKKY
ncbi:rho gtpase-activating protein 68f [Anaeramoeba flamelloides]|uniref:Rho gtpase-activating protein 68f n=1 Tax=Anaeramoeba flamelloides TaxID=1746091 RepID=A0ABQ8Z5H6_9EUKA|nr:rho gtpase-activating protein 68f [Anaeramoeba flamelloides]